MLKRVAFWPAVQKCLVSGSAFYNHAYGEIFEGKQYYMFISFALCY